MIHVGLIGFGYWGPNLARNVNTNPDLRLASICDISRERLDMAGRMYHQARLLTNAQELLKDTRIDAVIIATPVASHYGLAKLALESGRHVWLEKPLTEKVEQGEELIELAERKRTVLFVDHTFVYTGAVQKIKELVQAGDLGRLIYYDSTRVNLGLFQQDVDVIWDLAPHDISIMDHVMPNGKQAVSATGARYLGNGIVPKAYLTIYMDNCVVAHINVSWVAPVKIRQTLIGGSAKMILYDDTEPSEKVKVYDKGVDLYESTEEAYRLNVQYRIGDMLAPKLSTKEALTTATEHFTDCLSHCAKPLTDGETGLEVVKILVASKQSLKENGAPVPIA